MLVAVSLNFFSNANWCWIQNKCFHCKFKHVRHNKTKLTSSKKNPSEQKKSLRCATEKSFKLWKTNSYSEFNNQKYLFIPYSLNWNVIRQFSITIDTSDTSILLKWKIFNLWKGWVKNSLKFLRCKKYRSSQSFSFWLLWLWSNVLKCGNTGVKLTTNTLLKDTKLKKPRFLV